MKILLVDDSKTSNMIVAGLLRELGYTDIVECSSGETAWNFLANQAPDIILSDWHMPGITGLELLKYVRSKPAFAKVPFVMITTEGEKTRIVDAVKSGAQSYIFKPVKKDVLAQRLKELAQKYGLEPPREQSPGS